MAITIEVELVDVVGRALRVEASIDVKVIGVAAGPGIGGFLFQRTDLKTIDGRPIFRQHPWPDDQRPADKSRVVVGAASPAGPKES